MHILLAEDNETIALGLKYSLEKEGYKVIIKTSVKDAINYLKENKVSLAIIDVSLPDGSGFDLYQKYIDSPCIFLTALDSEDDIVKGLEMGAEDYMTKPFSVKELLARIKKILKNKTITVKDISFDLDKMEVTKNNKIINLTALELKILYLLFTSLNKVVSRDYIALKIWEWTGNDVNDNTITVYLKRIREKIDTDIIITIKGIGYRIDGK